MASTAISGIGGCVNGKGGIRRWSVNYSGGVQEYASSGTKGSKAQIKGIKDWSGSYDAYGHTPLVMPGDEFDFEGAGAEGALAPGASGPARCEEVTITVDIEGGTIISHVVTFSGNGELSRAAITGTPGTDVLEPGVGGKVMIGAAAAAPSYAAVVDVRTVTITLRRETHPYASSDTGGWQERVVGNLGGEVSYTLYLDDFSTLPTEGDMKAVKVYVNETEFWEIIALMVASVGPLEIDRESGVPIGATVNLTFSGMYTTTTLNDTQGKIDKPGVSNWWPGA